MPNTMAPTLATRKLLNCIVDDTALIAGLKKSTRDGIKKWVNNGAVRLFVPLHTLERLRVLAKTNERVKHDARETLQWLDDITNGKIAGLIQLQGAMEEYDDWAKVEELMLPETLLSMETETHSEEDNVEQTLADLHVDALPDHASSCSQESNEVRTASPLSTYSSSSPAVRTASPYTEATTLPLPLPQPIGTGRPSHKKSASNVSAASIESVGQKPKRGVPKSLRPFFNYILWRIHQEENAAAAMESFILVTNDSLKQQLAHRFGIRVKRLEQMREIIAREERDIKNRAEMLKKEAEAEAEAESKSKATLQLSDDSEDEVVFKRTPPKAPQAMTRARAMDPNAFARNNYGSTRGPRGAFRGRGGSMRGNYAPPRAMVPMAPRAAPVDLSRPIDPDSFNRASAASNKIGRGGRRHLWEPV
ncbi:hypothetical protein EJ08DRAFT_4788 [Tothia fuscella]|uniref:PIN domain-containing protein n=1 Tax=Tothia fuscella TaxID=1048955 RepID=A0A9P4U4D2_9PEZI|nr:hypothetical protein EJ08DRAFT_4788 [Tothia fuscella]